jgi:hypothetical protein
MLFVVLGSNWRRLPGRLLWFGFGCYLVITLVNLLSLHALDQFASVAWHGWALVAVLKFLCAAVVGASLCVRPGP